MRNFYVLVNAVNETVFFLRLSDRAQQPVPKRFVEALKKPDAGIVQWVAREVARWPRDKSEPILKYALEAQKKAGAYEAARAIESVIRQR